MKRNILHFLVLFVALLGCACTEKNILILFPEDVGNDLGSLGTPGVQTPKLDALAAQGVPFTSN
jgi:hypothetical protein